LKAIKNYQTLLEPLFNHLKLKLMTILSFLIICKD